MKLLMIMISTVFMTSCGSVTYVTDPLSLPTPLKVIKVPRGTLDCVPSEGKKSLIKRDKAKDERIKTLRNIIKSTY